MGRRAKHLVLIAAAIGVGVLAACEGSGKEASVRGPSPLQKRISGGTLEVGDRIPAPQDHVVLTIDGLITEANKGSRVRFDMTTLESLPRVEAKVYEPFERKTMTFEGVLLSDLIAVVGAEPGAESLRLTALDDYEVTLSLEQIARDDVLLATRANGKPISVVNGGPARVIFPEESRGGRNQDLWIWNVETIVVR